MSGRREISGVGDHAVVDARLLGVTSAIVSATLSVAAHGLASGSLPGTAPLALLALISSGAGLLAASVHRTSQARRRRGTLSSEWPATLTILLGAQAAGHVVSSLASSGAGHGHVAPAPSMLVMHVAALAAAGLVVAGAERCYRTATGRIAALLRPLTIPAFCWTSVRRHRLALPVPVWAAPISERGPPVFA